MVQSRRMLAVALVTAVFFAGTAQAQVPRTQASPPLGVPPPQSFDPRPSVPPVPTLLQPSLRPSVVSPQSMPALSGSSSPLDQEKAAIYRDQLRAQQNELQSNHAGQTIQGAERLRDINTELNRVNQGLQP